LKTIGIGLFVKTTIGLALMTLPNSYHLLLK